MIVHVEDGKRRLPSAFMIKNCKDDVILAKWKVFQNEANLKKKKKGKPAKKWKDRIQLTFFQPFGCFI